MSLQRKSIRRRIRLDKIDNEIGRVYSFTEKGRRTEYRTIVDIQSGACSCNCPDFRFRCRKTGTACKHIEKHVKALIVKSQRGTLELASQKVAA